MPTTLIGDQAATSRAERGAFPRPRLQRVLVGLDFAEPSQRAVHWAARHFAPGAELVLAHGISVPEPPGFLGYSLPGREQLIENARRGAMTRIREITVATGAERVWPEVRVGHPVVVIMEAAEEYDVDVIVVGAHGERTGLAAFLGTTGQHLLRVAHRPVLLARGVGDAPPRRLLVPLDDSEWTEPVLEWATFLASRLSASVVLLHVLSHFFSGALQMGASPTERARAMEQLRGATERWLEQQATRCRGSASNVAIVAGSGDPAAEILATGQRLDADLIVMGRSGAGRMARAMLGSTTERVLRLGDRAVMVVGAVPS